MLHKRVLFGSQHRTLRSSWWGLHCYRPWLSIDGGRCTTERETNCSYCSQQRDAIPLQAYCRTCIVPAWSRCTYQGIEVFERLIALSSSRCNPRNLIVGSRETDAVDKDVAREGVYKREITLTSGLDCVAPRSYKTRLAVPASAGATLIPPV